MPKAWDIRPSSPKTPRSETVQKPRYVETPLRVVRNAPLTPKRSAPRRQEVREQPRVETHLVQAPVLPRTRRTVSNKGIGSLKERRRSKRNKVFRFFAFALLILIALGIVLLWQPFLRVQSVEATGPHSDELPTFVQTNLQGTRYSIFPKNSIFFVPAEEIRNDILQHYPDVEAVSLSPSGLTAVSVSTTGRANAFWWCGTTYSLDHTNCFETDTNGKIFNAIDASSTTASTTPFIMFGLYTGSVSPTSPLGGVIGNSSKLPDMLRFVKALKGLGAPVVAAQIRDDEADLYTTSGTRITYVLGREVQAAQLAATAFPSLDVQGSSLLYVDLRFASKVYFKKRETTVGTPVKVR